MNHHQTANIIHISNMFLAASRIGSVLAPSWSSHVSWWSRLAVAQIKLKQPTKRQYIVSLWFYMILIEWLKTTENNYTHWVSCQRGSLAATVFQFLDTLCIFSIIFIYLCCIVQKHTETTSFTSAIVLENVLQLDPNRALPQLTKRNFTLHPLSRSQACERFKMKNVCWHCVWYSNPAC